MHRLARILVAWLACTVALSACTAAAPSQSGAGSATAGVTSTSKRVVAAIAGDPPTMHSIASRAFASFVVPGNDVIQRMVLADLGVADDLENIQPQLAESIPSIQNGQWQVADDGTMVTTWKIRSGATWQDGAPLTADDFIFGLQVVRDPNLAAFKDSTYDGIVDVQAPSPDTVVVSWKQPYIFADQLFANSGWPFPKHILGDAFAADDANLLDLPYWRDQFIGTGPYMEKDFEPGTRLILDAWDGYVLGRPKIDEIEIRIIADPTTLIANLLSGTVDMSMGRVFAISDGAQIRDEWQDGSIILGGNYIRIEIQPQLLNPTPAIVADPRFRSALLQGLDRQQLADTLQYGLVPVADSLLSPNQPEYQPTLPAVVTHPYDPQVAAQGLAALGLTKGADGLLRDDTGQPISVEVRTTSEDDTSQHIMSAVANNWQQLGVGVNQAVTPVGQIQDRQTLATYPGFYIRRQPATVAVLIRFLSSNVPLPSNNYVGLNYERYSNPVMDTNINQFYQTIDPGPRMTLLQTILHDLSDQVVYMGVFYDTNVTAVNKRVQQVTAENEGWNAQAWTVSS